MAKKTIPIALFFYVGVLSQEQATKVEAYFARGGYRTYFRRDVTGQKDIVERHVKIVGGGDVIPQRYVDAYKNDPTRILDSRKLADILADDTLIPPTVTPTTGAAFMLASAPLEGEGFGAENAPVDETVTTDTTPAAPKAATAPAAPTAPPAP